MSGFFPELRASERRPVAGAFATLLVIMTGHGLLETARDAIFLGALGPGRLPLVYLAVAAVSLGVFGVQRALLGNRGGAGALVATLVVASAVTAMLWVALPLLGASGPFLLYLWSAGGTTLAFVQFWSVVGGLFTLTQAKRVYAVIGAGAVLGAILGSGLAALLTTTLDPRHLLPAAALSWLGAAGMAARTLAGGKERSASPKLDGLRDALGLVSSDPYVRRILQLALAGSVALTLTDFVFKSVVFEVIPEAELGSFFARLYLLFHAASLLVQLLAVGRLVRAIGVVAASVVLPAVLALGALGVLATAGGLVAAVALKAGDGALRHTVNGTANELLFVPLSGLVRARVKVIVTLLGQRGGQAVASLLILAASAAGAGTMHFVLLLLLLLLLWIGASLRLRRPYVDVFRRTLAELSGRGGAEALSLDQASLEALFGRLNSAEDDEVLGAIELLVGAGKVHLVPALILFHPSDRIVVAAAGHFARAGRTDIVSLIDRVLGAASAEVHAALVLARSQVAPDEGFLRRMVRSSCPGTSSAAIAALDQLGVLSDDELRDRLEQVFELGEAAGLLPLAAAAEYGSTPALDASLVRMAASTDTTVRRSSVRAMATLAKPFFLDTLMYSLADREIRADALRAFERLGPSALDRLEAALADGTLPEPVRWELPRAIARICDPRSVQILAVHLPHERDRLVMSRMVDALKALAAAVPRGKVPSQAIDAAIARMREAVGRYLDWADSLDNARIARPQVSGAELDVLSRVLRGRAERGMAVALRLLGLLNPQESFEGISRGLRSARPRLRSSSRELLENVLDAGRRRWMMELVDRVHPEGDEAGSVGEDSYEQTMGELARSESASIREIARAQGDAVARREADRG